MFLNNQNNKGHFPAQILVKYKYLAHMEPYKLGVRYLANLFYLYKTNWSKWKNMNTIHLLINHRSYSDVFSPVTSYNEANYRLRNTTFADMIEDVVQRIQPFLLKHIIEI